ncbi:glutathione S-transferase domain-containing protein [Rutstroemia sp. NJR-2017a BBW]|nr:glutathione S-transferase domain-containing protein [Rutstroemia sp. NJR-2017a BBW]
MSDREWHIKGHLDAELIVTPALPPHFHINLSTRDTPDGESTIIELKMGSHPAPKITLYTAYACPWAHRSQVALAELGLEFETVHIDLTVPRTKEYLAINPRGLVPALSYNGEILTESGVISQFLVDAHPSHLEKTSREEGGALQRARYNFFIDTYISKINPHYFASMRGVTAEDREKAGAELVDVVLKEIEPLLQNAGPFFGGSERLTFVEVQTAGFVLRLLKFPNYEELLPKSILVGLEQKTPAFWKWANAISKEKSVTYVWNEKEIAEASLAKIKKTRAAAA